MADIHSLPTELIDLILSFVGPNSPPTFDTQTLRELPSHAISSSRTVDLKNTSRACRRFRELSRKYLFDYCRYELRDQDRFLAFLCDQNLAAHVKSVAISVRSIFPGTEKALWWNTLFEVLNPEVVTIVAPPYMIANLAHCSLEDSHKWAFEMPLQTMQFRQSPSSSSSVRLSFHPPEGDNTLFSSRPWTEILFNEGSSLRAYSNYEYYLLRVPSIMNHWGSVDPLQRTELPYPVDAISRLTSFHYTAVFPFYNHTNLVLKVVRNMTNLRHLSFQLAPTPESDIFQKELQTSTLDPNDPWMELHTSYSLIAHSVRYLGVQGKLVEFLTLDYKLAPLKANVFNTFQLTLMSRWRHEGDGLWVKRPEPVPLDSSGDESV
ncbi:hypothetical protein FQN57_005720 [Myotisia sp. PD_48]|nr:hypothetical protein FQN57_005720 [Myotisia sp. PD_48]